MTKLGVAVAHVKHAYQPFAFMEAREGEQRLLDIMKHDFTQT
jgi:hypothetical protein